MSVFGDIDEFGLCVDHFFAGKDYTHMNGEILWNYVQQNRKIYKKRYGRGCWAQMWYVPELDSGMSDIMLGYRLAIAKPVRSIWEHFDSLWTNLAYYAGQKRTHHEWLLKQTHHKIVCPISKDAHSIMFKITRAEYQQIIDSFKHHFNSHLNAL